MSSPDTESIAARLRQYDRPGPRYTSYPTAVEFNDSFDQAAYVGRLEAAASAADEPLSLYVHLPFCEARCSYCGCAVVITRKREVAERYLAYLEREIAQLAGMLRGRRHIRQLHWGGGTPTYLSVAQLERLHRVISRDFDLAPDGEQGIEIDPRVTTGEQLDALRALGFNRLSMGVQDLTPEVQEAIGRHQSAAGTLRLYEHARKAGFDSINIDLIYGLPRQTVASFERTLEAVASMRPERVAVYSYAHVPWLRPHQKAIADTELPDRDLKFELFGVAMHTFLGAGYQPIGMDHFALPHDELAAAARGRRLHRNFMGYTTRPASDLLGVGLSAIGDVRGAFAQNARKLPAYYAALDAGAFPIERGYILSHDDLVRRQIIADLMCNFHCAPRAIEERFGLAFESYFAPELERLNEPEGPVAHGFLRIDGEGLTVTADGRPFVRNICMAFDRYLASHERKPVFSRTI